MENSIALKDPVCGMAVTDKSFHQTEHRGHQFYFCGTKCKAKFAANVQRYAGDAAMPGDIPVPQAPPAGARWHRGWLLLPVALLLLAATWLWLA